MECLFPAECAGCQRRLLQGENIICLHCRIKLQRRPTISEVDLSNRFPSPLLGAYALGNYHQRGILQGLIHKMKYQFRPVIAVMLGEILAESIPDPCCGTLVPVPQTVAKSRRRGYNQAELLARGISFIWGMKMETQLLIRSAHKRSQTRMNRLERFDNMVDTLDIIHDCTAMEPIWLVDDVVTTGATLNACLHVLNNQGISRIGILVIASA